MARIQRDRGRAVAARPDRRRHQPRHAIRRRVVRAGRRHAAGAIVLDGPPAEVFAETGLAGPRGDLPRAAARGADRRPARTRFDADGDRPRRCAGRSGLTAADARSRPPRSPTGPGLSALDGTRPNHRRTSRRRLSSNRHVGEPSGRRPSLGPPVGAADQPGHRVARGRLLHHPAEPIESDGTRTERQSPRALRPVPRRHPAPCRPWRPSPLSAGPTAEPGTNAPRCSCPATTTTRPPAR